MKKKITSFIIILAMLMSATFVTPVFTHSNDACAKTKYVKVKQTTWKKYKKAYKENPKLKTQLEDLNTQLKDKKSQVHWLWETLEEVGYFYNYDTHQWEPVEDGIIPTPAVSEETIETMATQTGLVIDEVSIIDNYKSWYVYYVYADGDIYVITMQKDRVDVVTQLN